MKISGVEDLLSRIEGVFITLPMMNQFTIFFVTGPIRFHSFL